MWMKQLFYISSVLINQFKKKTICEKKQYREVCRSIIHYTPTSY